MPPGNRTIVLSHYTLMTTREDVRCLVLRPFGTDLAAQRDGGLAQVPAAQAL
jgi:hypothetical protein